MTESLKVERWLPGPDLKAMKRRGKSNRSTDLIRFGHNSSHFSREDLLEDDEFEKEMELELMDRAKKAEIDSGLIRAGKFRLFIIKIGTKKDFLQNYFDNL